MDAFSILVALNLFGQYLLANFDAIIGVLTALHALALAIINLTRRPLEGRPGHGPYRALEMVAGLITPKAKQ